MLTAVPVSLWEEEGREGGRERREGVGGGGRGREGWEGREGEGEEGEERKEGGRKAGAECTPVSLVLRITDKEGYLDVLDQRGQVEKEYINATMVDVSTRDCSRMSVCVWCSRAGNIVLQ